MSRSRRKFSLLKYSRLLHYWAALACALPVLVITVSGLLLILKKDIDWIQPPSQRGVATEPTLSFEQILNTSRAAQAGIENWEDVARIDVRPQKGLIKVRGKNGWEVQLDATSGEILQVAYRRTDVIEAIHDGSLFRAKYPLFLPASVLLLLLTLSGAYMAFKRWRANRLR